LKHTTVAEDDHLERVVHSAGSGMDPTECQEALQGLFVETIAILAQYHVSFSKLYATQLRTKYTDILHAAAKMKM